MLRLAGLCLAARVAAAADDASASDAVEATSTAEWPPIWADTSHACRLNVEWAKTDTMGWEGHHDYDIGLNLELWEAGTQIAFNMKEVGGVREEPSHVAFAKLVSSDETNGFILELAEWSEKKVVTFRLHLHKPLDTDSIGVLCTAWSPRPSRQSDQKRKSEGRRSLKTRASCGHNRLARHTHRNKRHANFRQDS